MKRDFTSSLFEGIKDVFGFIIGLLFIVLLSPIYLLILGMVILVVVLVIILCIVLSPYIIYQLIKESREEKEVCQKKKI